jgi:hypothetical protein
VQKYTASDCVSQNVFHQALGLWDALWEIKRALGLWWNKLKKRWRPHSPLGAPACPLISHRFWEILLRKKWFNLAYSSVPKTCFTSVSVLSKLMSVTEVTLWKLHGRASCLGSLWGFCTLTSSSTAWCQKVLSPEPFWSSHSQSLLFGLCLHCLIPYLPVIYKLPLPLSMGGWVLFFFLPNKLPKIVF